MLPTINETVYRGIPGQSELKGRGQDISVESLWMVAPGTRVLHDLRHLS